MGNHYTEEETEAWLEPETRDLQMPDGGKRTFTGYRLLWRVYDDVVARGYSPERLIGWTLEEMELQNASFECAFPGVLAYVDKHTRKRSEDG